ncbi:MAG: DUF402 domain-containing protein [Pseudonocardiaceae bacterium]
MTAPPTGSATHIHPPKVELYDLSAMTNTDPKGFVRPVAEYRVEPFGLLMARPVEDHPRIYYWESWLLPALRLRITDFFFHADQERDQDFYLDVARIEPGRTVWRSEDHYLDLVVRTGRDVEVLDTDELLAAVRAGLLDAGTAQRALEVTYRTIDGLAQHGYRLDRWLASHGAHPTWRRHRRNGAANVE